MYIWLYDDHYSGTDTGSSEPNSDVSLKLKLKLSAAVAESGSSFPKLCNVLYKFCILCFFVNCVIYELQWSIKWGGSRMQNICKEKCKVQYTIVNTVKIKSEHWAVPVAEVGQVS